MMKKILGLMILILAMVGVGFSQKPIPDRKPFESADESKTKKPTDADKTAVFDENGNIKRGASLSQKAKKVSLAKVLQNPSGIQAGRE